jgi:hypothetical protein
MFRKPVSQFFQPITEYAIFYPVTNLQEAQTLFPEFTKTFHDQLKVTWQIFYKCN